MNTVKQNSTETLDKSLNSSSRSIPMTKNEKKTCESSCNQDNSSSNLSRLITIQPENAPIALISRYDTTTLNNLISQTRVQTVVRYDFLFFLNDE